MHYHFINLLELHNLLIPNKQIGKSRINDQLRGLVGLLGLRDFISVLWNWL